MKDKKNFDDDRVDLWVSPKGSDQWSGRHPEPRSGEGMPVHGDGPLRSPRMAIMIAREWRRQGRAGPNVRVRLRGGNYPLNFPIRLGPEDNGLTIEGAPGEDVVIDGGLRPAVEETKPAGGERLWRFDVRQRTLAGERFESLFIDGVRRPMARFPQEGFLSAVEEKKAESGGIGGVAENNTSLLQGSPSLFADPAEMEALGDPVGRRMIILNRWLVERLRVVAWNPETGELVFDRPTRLFLKPEASRTGKGVRFYFEDLAGEPSESGTWTFDAGDGALLYRPLPDESLESAEIRVGGTWQFFRILGEGKSGKKVRGIRLRNLKMRHADWTEPCNRPVWWDPYALESDWEPKESGRHFVDTNGGNPYRDVGSSAQAAINVPGAVRFEYAEDCALEGCEIGHVGFYGVGVGRGCRNLRIVGCHLHDLGAGGVIAEGTGADGPPEDRTAHLAVTDCTIEGTGHVFAGACGVTLAHVARCTVAHNHIHDLSYTGISVGWVWGYAENPSYGHRIEGNHIHDVGVRGNLSDMGAIYLLGFQPGTFVRGNFIHDVNRAEYGGWGLYPDEGTSGVIFENNVVARCASHCLFEHFGRQNIYRNNILVAGGEAVVSITEDRRGKFFDWPPQLTTFERNILVAKGTPVFSDYLGFFRGRAPFKSSDNLYWDLENGADVLVLHEKTKPGDPYPGLNQEERRLDLEAFRAPGRDMHSEVGDPRFRDAAADDFQVGEGSPALPLGFDPIDLAAAGPRRKPSIEPM